MIVLLIRGVCFLGQHVYIGNQIDNIFDHNQSMIYRGGKKDLDFLLILTSSIKCEVFSLLIKIKLYFGVTSIANVYLSIFMRQNSLTVFWGVSSTAPLFSNNATSGCQNDN